MPATLVISPASICDQWCEEIDKHVEEGALKVLIYKGVRSKQKFIQPEDFLNYDVVITTFEVLRAELNHSDLHDDNTESPSKRSNGEPQQFCQVLKKMGRKFPSIIFPLLRNYSAFKSQ